MIYLKQFFNKDGKPKEVLIDPYDPKYTEEGEFLNFARCKTCSSTNLILEHFFFFALTNAIKKEGVLRGPRGGKRMYTVYCNCRLQMKLDADRKVHNEIYLEYPIVLKRRATVRTAEETREQLWKLMAMMGNQ